MGKWQCPKCSQKSDPLKSISPLDSISKRARTKLVTTSSRSRFNSSGTDKVSALFGSSILSKRRSSSKGKSVLTVESKSLEREPDSSLDVSCSIKPRDPSLVGSEGGNSSHLNIDGEKKPGASPTELPPDKKSIPTEEEDVSDPKLTESEPNNEASGEKHVLSSDDRSPTKKIVLAIGAASENRKRKLEGNNGDSIKKQKINKGKRTSKKHRSKSNNSSGVNKSHQKRKAVTLVVSAFLSTEDVEVKKLDLQKMDEVSFFLLLVFIFLLGYTYYFKF